MFLRLTAITERLRSSLFFVPMLYVVVAIGLGVAGLWIDDALLDDGTDLPLVLTSTVESARSVLATVAGATITVAGIAFSISLLIMQLASSQYSPRVVPGLFRDPFNKRIMGIVVGTFTYCLVVLRAVRSSLEPGGEPVVPNLSVTLAAVLGVVSILAIVAFISHNAHAMDVSRILHRVTDQALDHASTQWHRPDEAGEPVADTDTEPPAGVDPMVVDFDDHGWLQAIDLEALSKAADPGGTIRVDTAVGRFAVAGAALCTVWPRPGDEAAARDRARRSVVVGEARTSPQDATYGVRQLADVALKALSPGINDPTTAQDAMFHLASVLRELLSRRPPAPRQTMAGDRTVLLARRPTPEDLVGLAFDEVRLAASGMPTSSIYLLEIIHLLLGALDPASLELSAPPLRRQARLVRDGVQRSTALLPEDIAQVVDAYDARFGRLDPA